MTKKFSSAFTLIEMLVVIAIIAILIAMLYPAISGMQERGKITQDMNNLRQIGAAVQHYSTENDGLYPSGSHGPSETPPEKRLSLHASILPYLEQRPGINVKYGQVAATLDFQRPWDADDSRLPRMGGPVGLAGGGVHRGCRLDAGTPVRAGVRAPRAARTAPRRSVRRARHPGEARGI